MPLDHQTSFPFRLNIMDADSDFSHGVYLSDVRGIDATGNLDTSAKISELINEIGARTVKVFVNNGTYKISSSLTFPANVEVEETNGTLSLDDSVSVIYNGNPSDVKRHGAKGDGVNDDSTAFGQAIDNAIANARPLTVPAGTYRLNSPVSKTLTGDLEIVFDDGAKIDFQAATVQSHVFKFDLNDNAYTLSIEGNGEIDGNNKARLGIEIDNNSTAMANASYVSISNVYIHALVCNGTTVNGAGVWIRGGFKSVRIRDVRIETVHGQAGWSNPGSNSVRGITLTHYDSDAHIKIAHLDGGYFDDIISEDGTETADQDAVAFIGNYPGTLLRVSNCDFGNVGTRCVKSQARSMYVQSCHVDMTSAGLGATLAASGVRTLFDAQYGGFSVSNLKLCFNDVAVQFVVNGTYDDVDASGGTCRAEQIFVETDGATNTVSTVVNITNRGSSNLIQPSVVTGIAVNHLSAQVLDQAVRFVINDELMNAIRVDGCNIETASNALVRVLGSNIAPGGSARGRVELGNNICRGTACLLVQDGVVGSVATAAVSEYAVNEGFIMPTAAAEGLGDQNRGGLRVHGIQDPFIEATDLKSPAILRSPETRILEDDATGAFALLGGAQDAHGLVFVGTNFGSSTAFIGAVSPGSLDTIFVGSAADNGGTANNDSDGFLNVWYEASTRTLDIKNRLGSTRTVYVMFLGI